MPSDFDPHKLKDLVRRLDETLDDAAKARNEARKGLAARRRRDKGNQRVPEQPTRRTGKKS